MSNLLPVVVFAFNRPQKLRRILSALRPQNIDHLVVFVDGPRHSGDRAAVKACQQTAQAVDWVEKELHFSDQNFGSRNLHLHVGKVFEQYPFAIFLEDDCLPTPGLYAFMRQALERYRSEPRLFSIGGYQPVAPGFFSGYPYAVVGSARFIGWGWATWRARWQAVEPYLERFAELFDGLVNVPDLAGSDVQLVVRAIREGRLDSDWDYRVLIASLWLEKIHLLPVRGLIRNIGLDHSGVHGSIRGVIRDWIVHNRNVVKHLPPGLVWPANVQCDSNYMTQLREFLIQSKSISFRLLLTRWSDHLHRQ
jgi:hypothetical protein